MNDYKELIEKFRVKRNDGLQKDGSYQEQIITVQDILEAADVIEQLVKERDDEREASDLWRHDYSDIMEENEGLYKELCMVKADLKEISGWTPVVHGWWIKEVEYDVNIGIELLKCTCSKCGWVIRSAKTIGIINYNFCPNCGAKMDEEAGK